MEIKSRRTDQAESHDVRSQRQAVHRRHRGALVFRIRPALAMPRRFCCTALLAIAACSAAACRSSSAPAAPAGPLVTADTWAVVDGREITRQDVEKAFKRSQDPQQTLSDEE